MTATTRLAADVVPVLGDRVQLQQVFLNLVMNGIEAMSRVADRERKLVITTKGIDADQVLVSVEDSGPGVDPGVAARIFDPFFTTTANGMGMGLSITRSIVQNHGGRIWASGNDHPGTTFQFTLPKQNEKGSHAGVAGA